MSNKKGPVLVLDAQIDEFDFSLVNIYNTNTEKEQVSVNELTTIPSNFENIDNHIVIFAGDFNVFFEASGFIQRYLNYIFFLTKSPKICWKI